MVFGLCGDQIADMALEIFGVGALLLMCSAAKQQCHQ
jgi:hypothetical protein